MNKAILAVLVIFLIIVSFVAAKIIVVPFVPNIGTGTTVTTTSGGGAVTTPSAPLVKVTKYITDAASVSEALARIDKVFVESVFK